MGFDNFELLFIIHILLIAFTEANTGIPKEFPFYQMEFLFKQITKL